MAAPGAGNTPLAFPQAAEPPRVWCASPVGTGDPQLGLLWGSTLLSAMRTTGHLALSWAHFGPGQCLQAGSCSVGGLLGPPGRGCSSFLWPASSRGTERLAQGPISCDVLAPWAWQGIGCLHLHCLGHASESQPLVSHRGRFSEGQAWRGEHHGLRPPQGASQAALLLALAVSSALPPRGNSGCDLGLPWHGAPKADKQSQPRLDERPLRAECCAHALTVTQPREGLLL